VKPLDESMLPEEEGGGRTGDSEVSPAVLGVVN
jgi:hypothetical protein